ncbi:MAG: multidrug efflux pump subunit AcrA (membrane-fusion protein) [Zhongshania sp.]
MAYIQLHQTLLDFFAASKNLWIKRLAALALVFVGCSEQSAELKSLQSEEFVRAVSISCVELRSMARSLAATGLLIPSEEASVGSELSGFVVKAVHVEEGALVSAGGVQPRGDAGAGDTFNTMVLTLASIW